MTRTNSVNVELIKAHLSLLVANVTLGPGLQLELAWGPPETGPNKGKCFSLSRLEDAVAAAAAVNEAGNNVYVGITLKAASAPALGRTRRADVALATMLVVDLDSDLVAGARKLPPNIRPQLLTVTGNRPVLRGHLWIRLIPTVDMDTWDIVLRRLVDECGGDVGALGRSRVMRLAGTNSFPSAAKRQRGYIVEPVAAHLINAPAYELNMIANSLPSRPAAPAFWHRPRTDYASKLSPRASDVISALGVLPDQYAQQFDLWLRTGFALHDFDASARGLNLWRSFSLRCPEKAAATDFGRKWGSFGPNGNQRAITIAWLFSQARIHGWRGPRVSARARKK